MASWFSIHRKKRRSLVLIILAGLALYTYNRNAPQEVDTNLNDRGSLIDTPDHDDQRPVLDMLNPRSETPSDPQRVGSPDNPCGLELSAPDPSIITQEPRWYPVIKDSKDILIFTAFHDTRTLSHTVKILGVSKVELPEDISLYCQVWRLNAREVYTTRANRTTVKEIHGLKYGPNFFTCAVPTQSIIYAVSLTSSECGHPENYLPVLRPRAQKRQFNFTVCMGPFHSGYRKFDSFIESMEVNRLLGADKIVVYNHSASNSLDGYINNYVREGLVDLYPFRVPLNVFTNNPKLIPDVHYFAQVVSTNDCLYRYMYRSKYIAFFDVDQFIVPKRVETWQELIDSIDAKENRSFGAYVVRNAFFRKNKPMTPEQANHNLDWAYKLLTQLNLKREPEIWPEKKHSKCITRPEQILVAGIHQIFSYLGERDEDDYFSVPTDVALLHHYRKFWTEEDLADAVEDKDMTRYGDRLRDAVTRIHKINKSQ